MSKASQHLNLKDETEKEVKNQMETNNNPKTKIEDSVGGDSDA